jgi:uncharacterized protein
MRSGALLMALVAAFVLAAPVLADEVPIPPAPTQWVTDNVGVLSADTQSSLNDRLRNYERSTGHQVLVWIGATTGDTPLEEWTIKSFTAWKVGRKGLDDGVVLFLFTQDHKVRIEVGYGLEGVLTDAIASEIIRADVTPQMRANDPDAAVTSAVSDILATIGGENGASPRPLATTSSGNVSLSTIILLFLVVLIPFLVIVRLARRGLPYVIGSGWSGAGWGGGSGWGGGFSGGGGGGFSGGGGMGGGGGASGGW